MKLYEITETLSSALADMEENGFDAETIANTMESIEGEFNNKAVNVVKYTQNIKADIEALKAHEKTIAERRKTLENREASLKEYLRNNMERTGITKIECPEFAITLRKGVNILVIDDQESLPDDYIETVITEKIDKVGLKKALKDGPIDGCHLEKGKSSILIK